MRISGILRAAIAACAFVHASATFAASPPDWLRAQVSAPVPAHDEETNAVVLYSDVELIVQAPGKMKRVERRALKILRREGEAYGVVRVDFSPLSRVTAIRGWSIPEQGKAFEVTPREIAETGITNVEGGELISDLRRKLMRIPAATPGSIIGYEFEQDVQPYEMSDEWAIQDVLPVREAHYTATLPAGWSYKVFWVNHAEAVATEIAPGRWRWTLSDEKPIQVELQMPPWRGIAGRMVLSLQPPGGKGGGFQSWQEIGTWYLALTDGRRDPSPQLRQKVQELTANATDPLARMQSLAAFVQKDIRYVAIELGVGGLQPHAASEVLIHAYGDCKDKVTLLSTMLKEIGIESHYVIVNTERGAVTANTPPNLAFNHVVLAIQLPAGIDTAHLPALIKHKTLGTLLFFDPTHPLIPLGYLPGMLQANYGLLVTPTGGELLALPQTASELNGVQRTGRFALDEAGTLRGEVHENWSGDSAADQRYALRTAQQDADQIKPIESMLTHSLSTFNLVKATVSNLQYMDRPLIWNYTVEIDRYARRAGDLLIVRPRVLGSLSSGLLEVKEPRQHAIEFDAPLRNTDVFEITVPAGYVPDSLPQAVNEDLGAVTYRSSTELKGSVLRYTRTLEVKELNVPVAKAEALKQFFRTILADERAAAVLKRAP